MSQTTPCVDCGTLLKPVTPTSYQCPNPSCPGGSIHYLCGFCNRPSFSLRTRSCNNPACKTSGMRRTPCPECNNLSLISMHGLTFCINRRCTSNAKRLAKCPACGADSVIQLDLLDVCVKSGCKVLLQAKIKTLPVPAFERTFIAPAPAIPGDATALAPKQEPASTGQPESPTPAPAEDNDPYGMSSTSGQDNTTRATHSLPRPTNPLLQTPDSTSPPVSVAPPLLAANKPVVAAVQSPPPVVEARSEIERAFAFIRKTILAAPDQTVAPIILVFGLAGSGKSTYLTMLGDMLANGGSKYHFPYAGVTVRSIRLDELIDLAKGTSPTEEERAALKRRIRDLTYDYAAHNYEEHLINGTWAPATVRENGDDASAHSFFLLTEIVRNGAILGRLVTIETSGEDYQEVLNNLGHVRALDEFRSPLHRVLYRLIDAATGIIVLFDPASLDNDRDYAPFLRLLKDELEGRAAHALAQHVNRRLQADLLAERPSESENLRAVLEREEQDAHKRAEFEEARAKFGIELRQFAESIAATQQTHEGVAALAAVHQVLLDELELLMPRIAPDWMAKAQEKFSQHGRTAANYLLYFDGMLQLLRDDQMFRLAVRMRLDLAASRNRQIDQVIARCLADLGLHDQLHEAFLQRWNGKPASRRMEHLRYLSLVVTKSDRHPIVYPPSDYPKFKLPTCSTHLQTLGTYLGLLGGFLHCYNATAIGYAVQRGSQYGPGPGNSFTPVNIVEPLFDMLLAESERT